jgi:hypothetical protein
MKTSYCIKCVLAVLAVAVVFSWIGMAFDDEDLTAGFDSHPVIISEIQPPVAPPGFFGYNFFDTFRPLLDGSLTCYLKMHEKSPPSALPAF